MQQQYIDQPERATRTASGEHSSSTPSRPDTWAQALLEAIADSRRILAAPMEPSDGR